MTSVSEALGAKNDQLAASLAEGVRDISNNQQVTFNLYRKWVHPIDGMVYWVRVLPNTASATTALQSGLASVIAKPREAVQIVPGNLAAGSIAGGVIVNPKDPYDQWGEPGNPLPLFVSLLGPADCFEGGVNQTVALQPGREFVIPPAPENGVWVSSTYAGHQFTVVLQVALSPLSGAPVSTQAQGSLHYSTEVEQREDAVTEQNTVVFTSLTEIQPFNVIGADELYIGSFQDIRFAFSSRGLFFERADLYHYVGQALYSINEPLIIDDPADWAPSVSVSDSLPIWLGMNGYVPPYPGFLCPIPLYPSFLVTDNLMPPFGAVHVDQTVALQAAPLFGPRMQQAQLAKDTVRVTLYGADNDMAETFLAFVERYSRDWGKIGLANTPIVSDDKRPQPEFKVLSKKKTITFEVNYQQGVVRDEARQLILKAKVQFIPLAPAGTVWGTETGQVLGTETGQIFTWGA